MENSNTLTQNRTSLNNLAQNKISSDTLTQNWNNLKNKLNIIIEQLVWTSENTNDDCYVFDKLNNENVWDIISSKWFIEFIESIFDWEIYSGYYKLDNGSSFGDVIVVVFKNFEKYCGSNIKFEIDRESGSSYIWRKEKIGDI